VFLALHGKYGEDGSIQGLLEVLGIPYTGNGVAASAIAMDKDLTKRLLRESGLPVLPSITVEWTGENETLEALRAKIVERVGFPAMVKPLNEGSSVGMSLVQEEASLEEAIKKAAQHQTRIMIERFFRGRDLTVGVVQKEGTSIATPILELRSKTGWYDSEAKYTKGLTEFLLPAPLSEGLTRSVQNTSLSAHRVLGCHGVSRTDFVTDGEDAFYILEVNTIPGMTDLSDLPAQCQAMGIGYDELVELILQSAIKPATATAQRSTVSSLTS
jgi:D-alanine-D-alanine ligase